MYAYTHQFNENHLFATGLKSFNRSDNSSETILGSEESSNDDPILFVYNGLVCNKWKFYDKGSKLLLPSYEKAATILNSFDLSTKERKKVKLSFDFDTDSVNLLDFGHEQFGNENAILLNVSNFYYRSKLGYIHDFTKLFENPELKDSVQWESYYSAEFPEKDGLISHTVSPGSMFEKKLTYKDVTGYLWGLKSFKNDKGEEVPLKDRPCLVDLHGGPHYFTGVRNVELFNLMVNSGYIILTVNFSGSWSFGSQFNDRLAGKIGKNIFSKINQILFLLIPYR